MPEDLPDHLALRDSGDDPQRLPLTERAACHRRSARWWAELGHGREQITAASLGRYAAPGGAAGATLDNGVPRWA